MERQNTENLFRRYQGQTVTVTSISGGEYEGEVGEITSDYVLLRDGDIETFVIYEAIEAIVVIETET